MQLMLGSLVATQMALAAPLDAATICHTGSSDPAGHPDHPGHLNHHAPCSICAFASISPPLPSSSARLVVPVLLYQAIDPGETATLFTQKPFDPRSSQGPPRIS
jgi:hypothetical protein